LAKDYDLIGAMVDKVMDYLRLVAAGQLFHGVDVFLPDVPEVKRY